MAQIFAYITHKDGVADDSALELIAAAKKISADAPVTALVVGSGGRAEGNREGGVSPFGTLSAMGEGGRDFAGEIEFSKNGQKKKETPKT